MLNNISRPRLVGGWFAAVLVAFAWSVLGGAAMSVGVVALWLIACLMPPAVMLLVWPAPAATVAELLYAASDPIKEGRP